MKKAITKHLKIILISLVAFCFAMGIYSKVLSATVDQSNEPSKFGDYTTGRFSSNEEEKMYTIEDVIFNKIPFLDPNVFSEKPGGQPMKEGSINEFLRNTLAGWYVSLRNIVGALLIVFGIYNGTRMAISTVADEKAKYKEMLFSWVKSLVILMFIHILMMMVLNGNSWIVNRMAKEMTTTDEESMYYIIKSRAYDMRFSVGMPAMIMYIMLVYYYFKFLWRYVKRYFKILVLILMAPIIAGRAAFDSTKGKGFDRAFRDWFFDLFKTVFIQTVHVVEYIIFIRLAYKLLTVNAAGFIYAMIIMHFMLESEEIVTNIFEFGDKVDRFANMRSGFRSDMNKFKGFIGYTVGKDIAKKAFSSSTSGSHKLRNKIEDFIEDHNDSRRLKTGKATLLDKARRTRDSAQSRIYRAGIDQEALAFNRLSNDEVKDFSKLLKELQKGTVQPETMSENQKRLLAKSGLDPANIITRNKLKDLAEARKSQRRFSKGRIKANTELGSAAAKYAYRGLSRNVKGFVRKNKALNRRYIGHQNELILKDMALGSGSQAKVAKKTLKSFKEARSSAYKSRRQVLYKTVKGGIGAGLGFSAAVPLGVVLPPLGIAVAAASAKSLKNTKDMYTKAQDTENKYTKAYGAIASVAEGKGQMDQIMSSLDALNTKEEKQDAVNSMEKIANFNINSINLGTTIAKYINMNKIGEYSEVAINQGIQEISQDIINNAGTDLSVKDREDIQRAVERTMRQMASKYSNASSNVKEKDVATDITSSMQKNIIESTVKPEHVGMAYMINELQDIKAQGKDKFGVKKDTISDSIKELKNSVKNDTKTTRSSSASSSNSSTTDESKSEKTSRFTDSSSESKYGSTNNTSNTEKSSEGKSSRYSGSEDVSKPGDSGEKTSRFADTSGESKYGDTKGTSKSSSKSSEKTSRYAGTGEVSKPGDTKSSSSSGKTAEKTSRYADTGEVTKPGDTSKETKETKESNRYGDTEEVSKSKETVEHTSKYADYDEKAEKYGDTKGVVRPGDTESVVRPGDTEKVIRPGDIESVVRPSDTGKVVRPSDTGNVAKPGTTEDVVKPGTTTKEEHTLTEEELSSKTKPYGYADGKKPEYGAPKDTTKPGSAKPNQKTTKVGDTGNVSKPGSEGNKKKKK